VSEKLPLDHDEFARERRLVILRESEFDLQVAIDDLAHEIETRVEQISELRAQLDLTRREIAELTADAHP
jgi:hypothetical protein